MASMQAAQISMVTFYEHYVRTQKKGGNVFDLMDSLQIDREKIGSVNVKMNKLREWFKEKYKQDLPALARRPRTNKDGVTRSPVKDQLAKLGNLFAQSVDDDETEPADESESADESETEPAETV